MILTYLSSLWREAAVALGDHLWQSTIVALAAGLLTLALRKNHARARYWLWLAASLKFLLPFSLLVAAGSRMSWVQGPVAAGSSFYLTMEEASQPFTQSGISTGPASESSNFVHWLPAILAAVWFWGFVTVLLTWCMRWRRISKDVRGAHPLQRGREIEALRRAERATGLSRRVEMLLSRATLEPGIFGVSHPVLVWPEGISARLENPHLEAILAHELVHVRRRDNLAAAFHMAVEAIFWFHPLVWWLGTRLVDERERACDEQVLELGSERQVYAESILKVCEFCVGSPLACVAGVTGADLKKRMVHIMSEQVARKLDFTRKLLLSVVAVAVIAAPIVFGLFHAVPVRALPQSTDAVPQLFKSVSITPSTLSTPTYAGSGKHMTRMMYGPDGFVAANVTMEQLIEEAYGVQSNQISGPSDLLNSMAYDVQAKVDQSAMEKIDPEQRMAVVRQALREVLVERTKLVSHYESKQLPIYALLVGENGPKLQPVSADNGSSMKRQGMMMRMGDNQVIGVSAQGVSTAQFAKQLSMQLGTAVIDNTGLKGSYAFNLNWSGANSAAAGTATQGETATPSLFTAIQDQLGLKLEPQKAAMDVLVIDHLETPAEN